MFRWHHILRIVLTLVTAIYILTTPELDLLVMTMPSLIGAFVLRCWMLWRG